MATVFHLFQCVSWQLLVLRRISVVLRSGRCFSLVFQCFSWPLLVLGRISVVLLSGHCFSIGFAMFSMAAACARSHFHGFA